jgi:hypothetical protein
VVIGVSPESVRDTLLQPVQLWGLFYYTAEFLRLFTGWQRQQQQQQQQLSNTASVSLPLRDTITMLKLWARHHALDDAQQTVVKVVGQLLLEALHDSRVAIDAAASQATNAVLKQWRHSVRHSSQYASKQLHKVH